MSAPSILVILHQESSSPGRLGRKLIERGFRLDVRRPPMGDALPENLENHAGAIMFGGPMSANDPDEFIKRETDWLAVPLKEERPFLGICLGAQKLVKHLGGTVKMHSQGLVEIGYYPLEPTAEGRAMMDWPPMVYQWHREGFTLPTGATLLARGDEAYPYQAFRYGARAYGIQFHAELTLAMMMRWTVKAAHRLSLPQAQAREEHLRGRLLYDKAVEIWLDRFLDIWIGSASCDAQGGGAKESGQAAHPSKS